MARPTVAAVRLPGQGFALGFEARTGRRVRLLLVARKPAVKRTDPSWRGIGETARCAVRRANWRGERIRRRFGGGRLRVLLKDSADSRLLGGCSDVRDFVSRWRT